MVAVGGLRGAFRALFPGPYKILWELTLTGTVVSDIRPPPTLVGTPGIYATTAIAASPPLRPANFHQGPKQTAAQGWRQSSGLGY